MTNKPTIKDSLLLCASDLQHSAIYDNHSEMQSCIRAVADRITALASVIDGVGRAALAAPAQALHVAATSCPHEIDKDKIVLHFDSKQPGKNALAQLAARLQAAQAQPVTVPDDWQLVPRNITQDMAESAKTVDGRLSVFKYSDVYQAMLEAAPQPATKKGGAA